jgi:hypothetical protein
MQPLGPAVRIRDWNGIIMSAARLKLDWDSWNTQSRVGELTITFAPAREPTLVRHISPARQASRCPDCHSIIYSRRHKLCGVCSHPLPDYLLFTANEARRVEQLLRSEQIRHRQWMEQRTDRD